MSRRKITADLNGGDAITAMGDLLFQVHDGDTDAIIATANYAAIGSVNTNGTDGANITYTLNAGGGAGGNGQIILDGVEIGSAENIKIRAKDGDGNEGLLSASFSAGTAWTLTGDLVQESAGQFRNQTATRWATSYGVSTAALGTGETVLEMDVDDKLAQGDSMIGLSVHGVHAAFNDGTNDWGWAAYVRLSDDSLQVRKATSEGGTGSWTTCSTPTTVTWTAGDKISIVRMPGGGLRCFYNAAEVHVYDASADHLGVSLYGHIGAGADDATYDGYVSNPTASEN